MINQWSASFRFGLHLLPFRIGLESSPIFLRFLPAGMLQNVDEQVLRIRRILGRPVTNALHVVSLEDRISVTPKRKNKTYDGFSVFSRCSALVCGVTICQRAHRHLRAAPPL